MPKNLQTRMSLGNCSVLPKLACHVGSGLVLGADNRSCAEACYAEAGPNLEILRYCQTPDYHWNSTLKLCAVAEVVPNSGILQLCLICKLLGIAGHRTTIGIPH